MRIHRESWRAGAAAVAWLVAGVAQAEGTLAYGGELAVGTDVTFRGVSLTLGKPSLQATVSVESESGLYFYAWGSNVDFVPDHDPDDGARTEVDVAVGYFTPLTERWSLDTALVRYTFPGTAPDIDYDYTEFIATLSLDETYQASLAWSNDVFASGHAGLHGRIGAEYELPAEWMLGLNAGYYDLADAYAANYAWASVSVGRRIGVAGLTLEYVDTFGDAGEIFFEESTAARFVLTLDVEF